MKAFHAIALAGLATFSGCARVPPAAVPYSAVPRQAMTDPAAVYAAVQRNDAAVQTLRARFSTEIRHAGSRHTAEGVLLVKKPERFRIRLLSAWGLTVFDYTSWGGHSRMVLPLEGKELSDSEIDTQAFFSPQDMRDTFLHGETEAPSCRAERSGAETVVECRDVGGVLVRQRHIESDTQTVTKDVKFVDGQPLLTIEFGDYRLVEGVRLPFSITLKVPRREVDMRLTVQAYEVNPALGDRLFDAATTAASDH